MTTMADLPRVLLENYLMLAAAIENQNSGRMQDMLQYQQKVHHNLLEIVQNIENAPAVAMTTAAREPDLRQQQQEPDQCVDAEHHTVRGDGRMHGAAPFIDQQLHDQQTDLEPDAHFAQGQYQSQQQQQQQGFQQCSGQAQQLSCNTQAVRQQPVQNFELHQHQQQQLQLPLALLEQQQQQRSAVPAWISSVNQPVMQFLQGLGLQEYEPLLQQQAVDMAALLLMEERHLRELGLPIGAVVKIKAALAALR